MDKLGLPLIALILAPVFGLITYKINDAKGYYGGFWWGFFLGIIGVIIVACKPKYRPPYIYDFNEETQEKKIISDGGWKCNKCGRVNPNYTGTCACGVSKQAQEDQMRESIEATKEKEKNERELIDLQKLKAYKELLDSGVISQEEFDKKKAELIN